MNLEPKILKLNRIFFIFFAIFATTIAFEILQKWKYIQNEVPLPNDLLGFEILDYTKDNYTDNILYSVKKAENYYFYIKGHFYESKYQDKFKYFTSPLIQKDQNYYFCSSLKNIIKLNSNGELEEIPNRPTILNNYDNYELKCFYHHNDEIIVVAFINSYYVNSYNLKELKWIIETDYNDYQIFFGNNILDANVFNIENYDSNFRLGILIQNYNYNYQFILYKYDIELKLTAENYFSLNEGEIYTKKIISYGYKDTKLIGFVFTYEPKKLNKYNFFYFDKDYHINIKGNLYLTIFKEAEIYDAYFVENTPILIYIIKKYEKDLNYNYYLGAVDIESLFILYNINIDINIYKKVFYDYGFLYKNQAFLRIFEDGKQIEICPFIYNSEENSCQLFLNKNQYYYIDDSKGENENILINNCNKITINHYCMKETPFGLALLGGEYKFCFLNYMKYLYPKKECIWEGNEYKYINNSEIFFDCKEKNQKFFDYNCYNDCSEIYGETKKNHENECITCGSKNQTYYNNKCINKDECKKEGYELIDMELNGINYSFCQKCSEIGKFFYNYKCYDECPFEKQVNDSDNICYFCSEKGLFYHKGKCVSGCEEGYEAVIKEEELDCIYCKNKSEFYVHNKTCQNKCEKYALYDNDTNICYYCNEKNTKLKYFQNNTCVKSCDVGYGAKNEGKNYFCEFCYDIQEFYFDKKCTKKCPENMAWNDTDNICVDCYKEFNLLLKDHSCVSYCGTYRQINETLCIPCPEDSEYFFEYKCVKTCPKYTVVMTDNYCRICNGYFQDNDCVDECSKGYELKKKIIEDSNIEVEICARCESNLVFNGVECVEECPNTKFAEDNFCRLCFCGFSNYNCNKTYDKCICNNSNIEEGEIFGDNCEFYSKIKNDNKTLKIVNIGSVISSKKSFFTYELKDEEKYKNYNYSIIWRVLVDNSEITNLKNFPAGIKEKIFIINSNVLKAGKIYNELKLELNLTNENNTIYLKDAINISIQLLNQNRDISLNSIDDINKVMNTNFELDADNLIGVAPYKFYYQFLIKDEHNEIIPIKQKKELDPLLDKKKQKMYFKLPIFQNFFFELSNNREEKYIATNISKINENLNIEYNIEQIINSNLSNKYNEIEKIFLIMQYLDFNKNNNLEISINNYKKLFDFILTKLIDVAKECGHYESKENKEKILKQTKDSEESRRYYINYYEPKTIFSLINKLYLNQETKIPDEFFNRSISIFNEFFDILIKKNNNIEKLDNSNILSFFRTLDHLIEIYINKEKKENRDIIDKSSIFEILNKISKYLVNETYPGETIRLVGKKISLFLTHFGEFQRNLSFSSTNNISDNLKYDNYDTFSYDDYNINKEDCDDDGNTLFCIKTENYKEFKQKILNLQDYSLSLISINNNKDNNFQNENEGNSFELKLINNKDINKIYNNTSFFYDIEFPFNYIHSYYSSSGNKTKIFLQNNKNNNTIEKDYSNIVCVPKNHLKNENLYCLTYFNYETNIIKCSCNVMDEITYVSNSDLAKYYKDIQTKGKFKSYELFNKFTIYGILGLLTFILIPNFIYLLYEIKNDIKKANYKLLSFQEKIKENYLKAKSLNNTWIILFSILSFIFKFPYLSPLRNCNLNAPKYIKHYIITLGISYGMIVSLLLFLIYSPFKEKEDIINKRNIKNPNFEFLDKNIFFKYLFISAIFSLFGALFTGIFIYFFGIILFYNKDEFTFWKNIKIIFSNYVNNKIKDDVLLGASWKKIKLRMLAYYNICGNYILNSKLKRKKNNKNLENYLNSQVNRDNDNRLLPMNLDEEMTELNEKKNKSRKYRPPSIEKNNKNKKIKIDFNLGAINDSINESIINSNNQIVSGENFQLYGIKVKVDKSIGKNRKYERIKNKYICKKSIRNSFAEIDSHSASRSISFESNNIFKELEIEYQNNLSFLPLEEFIGNETIISNNSKKWKSSNTISMSRSLNPEGFWHLIAISFVMTILLLILICIMLRFLKVFLNDFGSFIIYIWLTTSIFVYILAYPFFYYLKMLFASILLFKCFHLRNRLCGKFLYWVFVDKTMINIYKVRNYVTKYKKEFEY